MVMLLTDALKQLSLQPGQRRRVCVDDYQVEIQRIDEDNETGPMQTLWLQVPSSSQAVNLLAVRGTPQLPAPFHVTDSDLAPE